MLGPERAVTGGRAAGLVPALLTVYFVWGSTYLAIRFAIETLPAFSMAGVRFLVAGALLYAWGRWRGGAPPTPVQLLPSLGIGALLLLGGNGGVVWAQHRIPSGAAALLVASEPVWIALLAPLVIAGARAGWRTFAGLALGVGGVAALVLDLEGLPNERIDSLGAMAVVAAALSWAIGSLWTARARLPESRAVATGSQMLLGGTLLTLAGGAAGEWTRIDVAGFSTRSLLAFSYLVVFGSILAFSAYAYLLRVAPPSLVATYAFVNPVVAVWLGWLFAHEPLGWRVGVASLLILGALLLIFGENGVGFARRRRRAAPAPPEPASEDQSTALRACSAS
jgi:drug/metabolite transporter (DMT)-like permease